MSELIKEVMKEIGVFGYILVLPLADFFSGRMTCKATIPVNEKRIPIGGVSELLKYTREGEKYLFYFWDGQHSAELIPK